MRDFKVGRDIRVGRDLHIHDQSNRSKLIADCTIEELLEEREHRKALLDNEKKPKLKVQRLAALAMLVGFGGLSLWSYLQGNDDLIVLRFAVLLIGFGVMAASNKPNEFEQRQLKVLDEIDVLLRERGQK